MALKQGSYTAVVMSGGGTRGAYEAGVIYYIRTKLPPRIATQLQFEILCGTSVGAINAAYLAATAQDPVRQGAELLQMWRDIRTENIYRTGPITLGKLLIRSVVGILAHLVGIEGWKKKGDRALHFQGFFDTQPFFFFLRQALPWPNINKNVENQIVKAVCVSATNMLSGNAELFIQKAEGVEHSERLSTNLVKLSPRHVMASAALPLLFPPVPIHNVYYNDGGLRLNTPLAPAVSLGASRILVIGTHHRHLTPSEHTLARIQDGHYPGLGEVLGKVYNSMIVDRLELDRNQVNRINRVLKAAEEVVSAETYANICRQAKVKQIETLSLFPSVDIATLVDETVRGSLRNIRSFSSLERFILRILETDPKTGTDFLSYFLFEPIYLRKLLDLGYEDARSKHDELVAFGERALRDQERRKIR